VRGRGFDEEGYISAGLCAMAVVSHLFCVSIGRNGGPALPAAWLRIWRFPPGVKIFFAIEKKTDVRSALYSA